MLRIIAAVALITPALLFPVEVVDAQVIEQPSKEPVKIDPANKEVPKEEPKKKPEITPGTSSETPPTQNGEDTPLAIELKPEGSLFHGLPVQFDFTDSGVKNLIQWPNAERFALLAWDRDQSGTIDSGGELLGSSTTVANGKKAGDGFEVLDFLDENRDGVISTKDKKYHELLVWSDRNHNGISEQEELVSLKTAGITQINTVGVSLNGKMPGVLLVGTYIRTTTGIGTGIVYDLLFKRLQVVSMGGSQ